MRTKGKRRQYRVTLTSRQRQEGEAIHAKIRNERDGLVVTCATGVSRYGYLYEQNKAEHDVSMDLFLSYVFISKK
jgi:hypothetical protein